MIVRRADKGWASFKRTQELIDAGCRGLADLRSRKFIAMVSKKQQVFVKYLEHMKMPIMRQEAEIVAVSPM